MFKNLERTFLILIVFCNNWGLNFFHFQKYPPSDYFGVKMSNLYKIINFTTKLLKTGFVANEKW